MNYYNNSYFKYIFMIFIILIDSSFLILIGDSKILFGIYIVSNLFFLLPICVKNTKEFNIKFAIFMMIFNSYFIEIYIHYFHLNIFIEAEYLYIIPLIFSFIKSYKNKHILPTIIIILFFLVNFILGINNTDISFYMKSIVPIITYILFSYSARECDFDPKKIYTFFFLLCITLTLLQTLLGFNRDTRNGVFGVFGLNAYSFFLICYPTYTLVKYFKKETKIIKLLISILITVAILICIENKATIIIMFIILLLLTIISNKIFIKKILIILVLPLTLMLSYKTLIKYYPFFSYLNNFDTVYKYFFQNNNRINYRYGRYESLNIVYSNLDNTTKYIGRGSGSSTPLDTVFYKELNRKNYVPYYIKLYGSNHGYHLTTISTVILDWGLISLILIFGVIIVKILKELKEIVIVKDEKNCANYIKFAALIMLLFYFSYSNILVNYRTMAVIALLLGTTQIVTKNGDINE